MKEEKILAVAASMTKAENDYSAITTYHNVGETRAKAEVIRENWLKTRNLAMRSFREA